MTNKEKQIVDVFIANMYSYIRELNKSGIKYIASKMNNDIIEFKQKLKL